jgi:hypothetical protein
MKNAALFCAMLISCSSQANSFTGTIDGEVTAVTGGPSGDGSPFAIGQLLTGSYSYTSPTVDGTFTSGGFDPFTQVFTPQNLTGLIQLGGFKAFFVPPPNNVHSTMTVQNGIVTYMDLDGEQGNADWYFYADHFEVLLPSASGDRWDITGTMDISPRSPVPDAPNSLLNLSLVLPFVFYGFHRRRIASLGALRSWSL